MKTSSRRQRLARHRHQSGRKRPRTMVSLTTGPSFPSLMRNEYLVTDIQRGGDVESSVQVPEEGDVADRERSAGDDSDFEVFDDAVAGDARDPYPELALARNAHPVQRLDTSNMPHDDAHPVFFVYRYEDVFEVLRDGETFSSAHIIELIMGDVMGKHIMLGMDNPEHRRYRALVSTAFSQKALARWESELIEPTASELIDAFAGRGHAELV